MYARPYPKRWGNAVRDWRRKRDILLFEMATGLGIKPSTLSSWETGRKPWSPIQRRKAAVWMSRNARAPFRSLPDLIRLKRLHQLARTMQPL